MKIELCDECRFDGGQHWTDDLIPKAYRPHHDQARQVEHARELSAAAHETAMQAGRLIMRDFAATHARFSANDIRHLFDAADIPDPCVGAVFLWAASKKATASGPLIVAAGSFVRSSENTTRHKIAEWDSTIFRARAAS